MVRSRKGTEQPIEIFVALFVILAVALVLLKLFQGQISQKQKELTKFEQEQKLQDSLASARQYCNQKCTEVANDGCSLTSRASFCVAKIKKFIDLNANGANDYDTTFFPGLLVCEDGIYCHRLVSCTCNLNLDFKGCVSTLCSFWANQGFSSAEATAKLRQLLNPGSCPEGYTNEDSWYKMANDSGLLSCP